MNMNSPIQPFAPPRGLSATAGPTNANRSSFTFRVDDENAPPDPTLAADAIIPGGSILAFSRQSSTAPSVSTLTTPRASTPITAPFSPSPLRGSLMQGSTSVPGRVGSGRIRFRVDHTLVSTFDPKDKELYELWAGRLP